MVCGVLLLAARVACAQTDAAACRERYQALVAEHQQREKELFDEFREKKKALEEEFTQKKDELRQECPDAVPGKPAPLAAPPGTPPPEAPPSEAPPSEAPPPAAPSAAPSPPVRSLGRRTLTPGGMSGSGGTGAVAQPFAGSSGGARTGR